MEEFSVAMVMAIALQIAFTRRAKPRTSRIEVVLAYGHINIDVEYGSVVEI